MAGTIRRRREKQWGRQERDRERIEREHGMPGEGEVKMARIEIDGQEFEMPVETLQRALAVQEDTRRDELVDTDRKRILESISQLVGEHMYPNRTPEDIVKGKIELANEMMEQYEYSAENYGKFISRKGYQAEGSWALGSLWARMWRPLTNAWRKPMEERYLEETKRRVEGFRASKEKFDGIVTRSLAEYQSSDRSHEALKRFVDTVDAAQQVLSDDYYHRVKKIRGRYIFYQ